MKFDESSLRLITPVLGPTRERAVWIDVNLLVLPEDIVASSAFTTDLNLKVVELKFVLDSAEIFARRRVEGAERRRKVDVVIDRNSHCLVLC